MVLCPKCESKRVVKMSKAVMALVIICVGSFVFFVLGFLFPLFWVGIPACWVLGLLMLLGTSVYQCQYCRHSWPVPKKRSTAAGELKGVG